MWVSAAHPNISRRSTLGSATPTYELQAAAQATAAEATVRARELALKRYEAGVTDFYALLSAEQERLAAADALIQVQTARAAALLGVHKAFAARLTASQ